MSAPVNDAAPSSDMETDELDESPGEDAVEGAASVHIGEPTAELRDTASPCAHGDSGDPPFAAIVLSLPSILRCASPRRCEEPQLAQRSSSP